MADTILRQIEMLRHIPRTGKITPQQLQQRLESTGYQITERTIQRDLVQLSTVFSLECDDQSKPYGWRWSPGMPVCQLPGLTMPEALAFQMLAQFSGELLPISLREQLDPYFDAAKKQLSTEVGPKAARNWALKVRTVSPNQPLLAPAVRTDVLDEVHASLMAGRRLRIRYRTDETAPSEIHPLGLVQHGQVFYLVANYDGYQDIRLLAVHRIRAAEVLKSPVAIPQGFDLDEYIAAGGFGFGEVGKSISVELKFFNYAGSHLKETPLSEDQIVKDGEDGQSDVTATVKWTRRLQWWLLGFGSDVEVVKPAALRARIGKSIADAAARYSP